MPCCGTLTYEHASWCDGQTHPFMGTTQGSSSGADSCGERTVGFFEWLQWRRRLRKRRRQDFT